MSDVKIRVAKVIDYDKVRPLAVRFYEATQDIPWDEATAQQLYLDMVEHGFILMAMQEQTVVGIIGCLVAPFLLNKNYKMATEVMWWVEPEARGTAAASMLMDVAEQLAKIDGCYALCMSLLTKTSPKALGRVYERRGYEALESTYMKVL